MSLGRARADELLYRGLAAAKSGNPNDIPEAEYYLEWVTITDSDHDQQVEAWYWLSKITNDPVKKREYLESALAIQPSHPDARRDLAILDGKLKPEEMRANPLASGAAVMQSAQIGAQETRRFKCPRCGAMLTFQPGMGQLKCHFCGVQIDDQGHVAEASAQSTSVGGSGISDRDWVSAIHTEQGHRWALPQHRVMQCQGCGANVTFAPALASAHCGYCGSPYAVRIAGHDMDDLHEPDGVIPFRFDANTALAFARAWLKERAEYVGVPGDLPTLAAFTAPTPVYLPFWTFDIAGEVRWSGWVRDDIEMMGVDLSDADNAVLLGGAILGLATGNVSWAADNLSTVAGNKLGRDSNLVHREGSVGVVLTNVPVPATHSLPEETLSKLEYEMSQAVPYREDVLANWPAEVYSVSMADASLSARQAAIKDSNEQIALQAGVTPGESNTLQVDRTGLSILSYRLMLAPVWSAGYTYKGQSYRALINGQSGQVDGETPRNGIRSLLGR